MDDITITAEQREKLQKMGEEERKEKGKKRKEGKEGKEGREGREVLLGWSLTALRLCLLFWSKCIGA